MFGLAFDPCNLQHIWAQGSEDKPKPGIQAAFGIQPAISVGRLFMMVFLKQQDVADEGSCSAGGGGEMACPAVKKLVGRQWFHRAALPGILPTAP